MLHLSKKYIPSAKTLYKEDLSNINFNHCENSPNSSCHFWNHKLFFTTQLVCIFLAQTLHTFDRNIASKCTFSDFPLLEFKVQIIRLSTAHMRISQIPCIIFQATSQFSFKFYITFKCYDTKFFWNFPSELLRFGQIERIKVQILRFLFALMKVHRILHGSFETTRSRFIQIFHHCSVSWKIAPLYFFLAQTFIFWTKSNFQTFEWLDENSPNSLCHVWNFKSVFL